MGMLPDGFRHPSPELEDATGLSQPELSTFLVGMNLALIQRAPMEYLQEVARSFAVYWFPAAGRLAAMDSVAPRWLWVALHGGHPLEDGSCPGNRCHGPKEDERLERGGDRQMQHPPEQHRHHGQIHDQRRIGVDDVPVHDGAVMHPPWADTNPHRD
jgi:hypothetical protein